MRLRQAVQGEVERTSALFGMPTRSDLDAAFRKIADLERSLRGLRDQLHATGSEKPKAATGKPSETTSADRAAKTTKPAKARARTTSVKAGAEAKGKRR